jgi:hypothetical protein
MGCASNNLGVEDLLAKKRFGSNSLVVEAVGVRRKGGSEKREGANSAGEGVFIESINCPFF